MKTKKTLGFKFPTEFRPLFPPPYQAVNLKEWELFRAPDMQGLVAAYFSAGAPMPPEYWVLSNSGVVWMSLTPTELESQGFHARLATGHVLVMGLGMGAVVFGLLRNPAVTKITVCEREPAVVDLIKMGAPWFDQAVKSGKVEMHVGNTFDYVPSGVPTETLIVDIWTGLGTERAEPDVRCLQRTVGARRVAWWGQELAFVTWIHQNYDEDNRFPFRRDHVQAYERHLGFKLLGADHRHYPMLVLAAASNVAAVMMQQQRKGPKLFESQTGTGGWHVESN